MEEKVSRKNNQNNNQFVIVYDNAACRRAYDGVVDESDFVLVDLSNAFLGEIDQVNGEIIFYQLRKNICLDSLKLSIQYSAY